LLFVFLAAAWGTAADAGKRTVCTITVNSSDEKDVFRRHLPPDDYQFVELVERGRPDWLASACRQNIRCDILIVSGHFNGTEFFSDRLDVSEFLPVQEMERASCNPSCSGVFSQLKEVYLFGCNTLNPETSRTLPSELERTLVRAGYAPAEADRVSKDLGRRYVESNRDVTRRVFMNVPVIYGFSSRAPVGPTAASLLNRYFPPPSGERLGSGNASRKLLASFAANSMTAVGGIRAGDPQAAYREEACRFLDERLSNSQKLDFIHQILRRDAAEVRMFLDRIEGFLSSFNEDERHEPPASNALDAIVRDQIARDRFLRFARDADQASVRARMTSVARDLGWLSPADYRAELLSMIRELLTRPSVTTAEVDLICSLNDGHDLDRELDALEPSLRATNRMDHAAALACLGSSEHHDRMLLALSSPNDDDVRMADVYFRHRPITDVAELRVAAMSVARMNGSDAQARAIDILARQPLSDRQSLAEVTRLFPVAASLNVQRAIAGLIIRSDYRAIATPETIRMLRESRLKSPSGEDIIDILIRRLEAS
jgi:hypothetical protein